MATVFGTPLALLGLGTLGFFVGPPLVAFLALEGEPLAFCLAGAFFSAEAAADEAAAAAFLPRAAVPLAAFLSVERFALVFAVEDLDVLAIAAVDPPPPCRFPLLVSLADAACLAEAVDASLNEPDAPFPFVWMSVPDATADLRYFLMNGDIFSASIL